ncbi:MAG: 2OG-Fe(II) oxygenase, partial [Magnetococcales bacterium]|nr:2OG-Fe(II) oxygenase [Magnetococcales bacterium]
GMFATLVIVLPSHYEGGELIVEHQGQREELKLNCSEPSEAACAAFYADCRHQVQPITSGCRLTLVYNLVLQGKKRLPKAPEYGRQTRQVASLLETWRHGESSEDAASPEKIIYPLEYAYSASALSFQNLKGQDAGRAGLLIKAAQQADCALHLVLVAIEEQGIAEHSGGYHSYRRGWDNGDEDTDEFEVVEVCDSNWSLRHWQSTEEEGAESLWGAFPFEKREISPPGLFDGVSYDEEEFYEATGNEGASFERSYRRAALVIWPKARELAIIAQAGLAVGLPYLSNQVRRWEMGGKEDDDPLRSQASELAGHMLDTWTLHKNDGYRSHSDEKSNSSVMLSLLLRLKHVAHLETLLTDISAQGELFLEDIKEIVRALALLPKAKSVPLAQDILEGNLPDHLGICGALLRAMVAGRAFVADKQLVPVASVLVKALPDGSDTRDLESFKYRSSPRFEPSFIVDMLGALAAIDHSLTSQVCDTLLACPEVYPHDEVLIPACIALEDKKALASPEIQRILAVSLDHLNRRIALLLESPRDWQRDNNLSCTCEHCQQLAHFLGNASMRVWRFKAAEAKRRHVIHTISDDVCDATTHTDRQGRPYSLICTKNQASYQRRYEQRAHDLSARSHLMPKVRA